ncbi:Uncharacterised protein [Mycobacteroides abscessus subsp. abscessus]|nr:Uncharacterised protein [Mycobacteroides abscessus subsp. abscessus]
MAPTFGAVRSPSGSAKSGKVPPLSRAYRSQVCTSKESRVIAWLCASSRAEKSRYPAGGGSCSAEPCTRLAYINWISMYRMPVDMPSVCRWSTLM